MRGATWRRLPAYAAVACRYAVATYQTSQHHETSVASREARVSEEHLALMNAYGGRESLEDLEAAARVYSAQNPGR
ncbi:hypothetical protein SPI_01946 [Niveomyces insectorum RCEF 264]|uniref:Uncharacterized protein n=1 Tax=Niveomyces insectorum RCEF 264 TaxID=1081102 RepID=A0A167XMH8_9HYPO|nr:hypothetical protein SPI_01946 [Niveomyces insectorum RCEF 264]